MTRIKRFSKKQRRVLTWWCAGGRDSGRQAIICDGAVRSGKTLCMSLSFVAWSMAAFNGRAFAFCGRTILSLRRNVLAELLGILEGCGFSCTLRSSQNVVEIARGERRNRYYLFGGGDEGAAARIQGVTLAGVLFDEVALMPRSFVEQALARCSVDGSRFWFNCNPEHPRHWFYREWILRAGERNTLYLHFTMADNPALTPAVRARYESLYTGAFRERFVLGNWAAPAGLVYPMFLAEAHVVERPPPCRRFVISCDYGTVNPMSMGLWGESGGVWYRLAEFYHDSRAAGFLMTDEEYADALETLAGGRPIDRVVADPSAVSFMECVRRRGRFSVSPGRNEVLGGIRRVADALKGGKIRFAACCGDSIREFGLYRWDERAAADRPLKENDHAMDDIRYFVSDALAGPAFCAVAAPRTAGLWEQS